MKLKLCVLSALLFAAINCFAQEFKMLDHTNSSIPGDELQAIAVDQQGNKWISGKSGLYKYDGKRFTPVAGAVPGGYYSPIYVDSKNNIWVAFSGNNPEVVRYSAKGSTIFNQATYPGLAKDIITIVEDKHGKLFFGTSQGVVTFDGIKWGKINLPGEATHLYIIRALDIDDNGKIALAYDDGLLISDGKDWKSYKEGQSQLQLSIVRALKFMPTGELYIGYGGGFGAGGFSILKGDDWKHYNIHNSKLPDQMVRSIVIGNNGVIWMGTNNGLVKIDGDKWTVMKPRPKSFSNPIMDIAVENGKTWATTYEYGLIQVDNQ